MCILSAFCLLFAFCLRDTRGMRSVCMCILYACLDMDVLGSGIASVCRHVLCILDSCGSCVAKLNQLQLSPKRSEAATSVDCSCQSRSRLNCLRPPTHVLYHSRSQDLMNGQKVCSFGQIRPMHRLRVYHGGIRCLHFGVGAQKYHIACGLSECWRKATRSRR